MNDPQLLRTPAEEAITVRRWIVLAILVVALIFAQLDRLVLSALIESIKHTLALSDRELGILQGGAFGLFYTIMGLPLGMLADRWSNRGTIVLGYTVWSFAAFMSGFVGSYPLLLAARVGVGAGEAALSPAGYSLIRQYFPPARLSLAISLFQMGSVLGLSSAFAVVGALQGWFNQPSVRDTLPIGYENWQLTFMTLGAAGLAFLPVLFLLRGLKTGSGPRVAQAGMRLMPFFKQHVATLLPLFLGMAGVIVVVYAVMGWLSAIFSREFGWGPTRLGPIYSGIVLVASSVGIISGGWLTDRVNQRTNGRAHLSVPLAVCAALMPLILLLATLHSPAAILAVVAAIHVIAFLPLSVAPTFAQIWAPYELRGQISAVYILFVNGLSLGVAPVAIGFLSASANLGAYSLRFAVGVVTGVMLIVSFLLLIFLKRREQRRAPNQSGVIPRSGA
jgi:MFS family permease